MIHRIKALLISMLLGLSASSLYAATPAVPDATLVDDKDLCSYLKDVDAKTDSACAPDAVAALKIQDPGGLGEKYALAQKRKTAVQAAYEYLKELPPAEGTPPPAKDDPSKQPSPYRLRLEPPINGRTFPAWIGTEAKDFKAVYARWLLSQNAELEHEQQGAISAERRKQITAQLAQNQTRISGLEKIKDPAQLSCFLGECCGTRADVSGPGVLGRGTGRAWTPDDFARANAQTRNQSLVPGGKLDRGMPSLEGVASEVVANSPLGPLTGQPIGNGQSPARTAAELALATAGGLLLFWGFGGKKLEETVPGIRKGMATGAVILGLSGASALSLSEVSIPTISLGGATPAPRLALTGGGTLGGGTGGLTMGGAGTGALKVGALFGGAKVASDYYSYAKAKGNPTTGQAGRGGKSGWGDSSTLPDHFQRHGLDFGAKTEEEYVQKAVDFLDRAEKDGLPRKVDENGITRAYDPKSNTFGSYNPDRTIKTFYKPDPSIHGLPTNIDYWAAQPGNPL